MKKRPNDVANQQITRMWGNSPVFDATKDLRVIVQPCDVTSAVEKDPGHCVFAQACKRSFGAKKILFFRSIAYVELPDENGNLRVERFELSRPMSNLIATFDKGEPVLPQGGFVLKAPRPCHTLEAMHKQKKDRKQALLNGTAVNRVGKSGLGSGAGSGNNRYKNVFAVDLEIRSGTGHVHFTTAKK